MKRLFLFSLLLLSITLVGCGPSGPKTYPVSGTVTVDGRPLAEGEILFVSEGGNVSTEAGKIENGQYAARVTAGKKRVEITAHREVEGKTAIGAMGEELKPREQFIPSKYNSQSELAADITDSQSNLDFSLNLK